MSAVNFLRINTFANGQNQCAYSASAISLVNYILSTTDQARLDELQANQLGSLDVILTALSGDAPLRGDTIRQRLQSFLAGCFKAGTPAMTHESYFAMSSEELVSLFDWGLVQSKLGNALQQLYISQIANDEVSNSTYHGMLDNLLDAYLAKRSGAAISSADFADAFSMYQIENAEVQAEILAWCEGQFVSEDEVAYPDAAARARFYQSFRGQQADPLQLANLTKYLSASLSVARQGAPAIKVPNPQADLNIMCVHEALGAELGHYSAVLANTPLAQAIQRENASATSVAADGRSARPELLVESLDDLAGDAASVNTEATAQTASSHTTVQELEEELKLVSIEQVDEQKEIEFKTILDAGSDQVQRDRAIAAAYQEALYNCRSDAEEAAVQAKFFGRDGEFKAASVARDAVFFKPAVALFNNFKQARSRADSADSIQVDL